MPGVVPMHRPSSAAIAPPRRLGACRVAALRLIFRLLLLLLLEAGQLLLQHHADMLQGVLLAQQVLQAKQAAAAGGQQGSRQQQENNSRRSSTSICGQCCKRQKLHGTELDSACGRCKCACGNSTPACRAGGARRGPWAEPAQRNTATKSPAQVPSMLLQPQLVQGLKPAHLPLTHQANTANQHLYTPAAPPCQGCCKAPGCRPTLSDSSSVALSLVILRLQ